ncbi:MAG: hypothetical protein AAGF79_14170 [Pseudomonadota bacterium]
MINFAGSMDALFVLGMVAVCAVVYAVVRGKGARRLSTPKRDDGRFTLLASRSGGRVVAERLVSGELRLGAASRSDAIENAIEKLARDRRSWR